MLHARMRAMRSIRAVSLGSVLLVAGILAQPISARAAYPGSNGRLIFPSTISGSLQIWSMLPDGTGQTQLTHVPISAVAEFPDASPDGKKIAFTSDVTGELELYTMNSDGSALTRITHDPKAADVTPRFSPDGTKLLFYRCPGRALSPFSGNFGGCNVWVMNADGTGGRTKLTTGEAISGNASYSPDGSKIVFESTRNGAADAIWVMDASGENLHRLTPKKMQAAWADWSPDGTKIVFMDNCCRPHSSLWLMNPDGSGLTRLTEPPGQRNDIFPSFAPAGDKIVFTSDRPHPGGGLGVYTVNLDGTAITRVPADVFPDLACDFCGPNADWAAA